MNREPRGRMGVPERVVLICAAVTVLVILVFTLDSTLASREAGPPETAAVFIDAAATPIDAEAGVFRIGAAGLAADPRAPRRTTAHPRTLATFRALRAFPGAPPRIPHGLTSEEFRTTRCNTCHEQGGYSARFGAYVPVTPHPELTDCLQCHVGDDAVVGVPLPSREPDAVCRQCHAPGVRPTSFAAVDWQPAAWPPPASARLAESPPVIPHDLQLRGNCLACHMGPGAVEEIRTTHPERANCRQCHVLASFPMEEAPFTRPLRGLAGEQ